MKIIKKDIWGFWIFKRYSFYLEDDDGSLTEMPVEKYIWDKFNENDFFDMHYMKFFKTSKCWWMD